MKYDYDANRMRVKKLVGSTATYFLYGLNGSLLGEYTPASQLQKEYFYLGSKLLAEREKTSLPAPTITYYHDDIVGSPIGATDKTGALAWREHYWPYGERNIRDSKAAKDTRWFAGKSQDAESKLSYFGARYYDPLLGRFMGIDPVGVDESNVHSHNRYAYGNNNPYKYVDPTGNIAETALDVVSLGLSIAQFQQDPSILNGIGLAYDVVGTAVPILPAGFGIIRSAGKAGVEAAVAANRADNAVDSAKALKNTPELIHTDPRNLIPTQSKSEISGSQVKRLTKDMKQNGFNENHPISATRNSQGRLEIENGHHRREAAIKAGIEKVPVEIHH